MVSMAIRWRTLWERLDLRGSADAAYAEIERRYSEPHRRYHTLDHVARCLSEVDEIWRSLDNPPAVRMALWLHDVVYDPLSKGNEERSAFFAGDMLVRAGASDGLRAKVAAMIMSTTHTLPPWDNDSAYVLDIDLAILAAPPDEFERYREDVRFEYSAVPQEEFDRGTVAFFSGLLSRPSIYHTHHFRGEYEERALWNITRMLRGLET